MQQQSNSIGVVGVAGLYRTGKSYLLNLLTGCGSGFEVGSTVNACTKGIWIWSEPTYNAEKNIYVYYMDTEGLGSTTRTSTHDSRIFALTLLLSSYFIYNSRGVIDGQALEDLSLVASLTNVIQSKSSGAVSDSNSGIGGASHDSYFPIFVWVLRDFTLKLEDDKGKKINSNQYLENCLKPQSGFSEAIATKNQIRRLITDSFRERECVTLVRPAEDENVLRNLSQYSLNDLRPEFHKQMKSFLNRVSSNVRPKQVMGRSLNGEMFATLVESYAEALNSGEVPEVHSAWSRVISTQCAEAKQAAMENYDKTLPQVIHKAKRGDKGAEGADKMLLEEVLPVDLEVLMRCHDEVKKGCKEIYRSKLMDPHEETAHKVSGQLKSELRRKALQNLQSNNRISNTKSTAAVNSLLDDILSSKQLSHCKSIGAPRGEESSGLGSIMEKLNQYKKALDELDRMVDLPTSGPTQSTAVWAVQNSAMSGRILDEVSTWASSVADSFRSAETKVTAELHELELGISTVKATLSAKRTMLERQIASNERAEAELRERIADEEDRFEKDIKRKDAEKKRYEEMLQDIVEMHKATMVSLTARQKDLRTQLEVEREAALSEQRKLGADRTALKTETKNAEEQRSQEADKLQESIDKQEAHIKQLRQELDQCGNQHKRTLARKKEEYAEKMKNEMVDIENEKERLKRLLKLDYNQDETAKKNEVKELEELVRIKEDSLRKLGVAVDAMVFDSDLGTGKAHFMQKQSQKSSTTKKKQDKGCRQS